MVEKLHGKDMPKARFRELCREYAAEQIARQKKDFIRLGVLGDWDNPYLTMDFKTEADTVRNARRNLQIRLSLPRRETGSILLGLRLFLG